MGYRGSQESRDAREYAVQGDGRTDRARVSARRRRSVKIRDAEAYRRYWWFAKERQRIFRYRWEYPKNLPPWTEDRVLQKFSFTNAFRASDRTSQYLIQNVIYKGEQSPREVFF